MTSPDKKEGPREIKNKYKEARLWNHLCRALGSGGEGQEIGPHPVLRLLPRKRLQNTRLSLGHIPLSMLCGRGDLGILLPKMGRKAFSKCFLQDPEFNLESGANMFILRGF